MKYTHAALTSALEELVRQAEHVSIRYERMPVLAAHLGMLASHEDIGVPPWADPEHYADEFPAANTEDTLQLFFVMIAQGYQHHVVDATGRSALWQLVANGQPREGVHAMYACATRALQRGLDILDPQVLVSMTLSDVEEFYTDEATGLPNLSDLPGRLARFQEIGGALVAGYHGRYANLLRQAGGYLFRADGNGIVQRLVSDFPLSYGDWPFCKLAVTPARMLHDRRRREIPTSDSYLELTEIRDPEHFDAGADAARPFALLRLGVLEASRELAGWLAGNRPMLELPGAYDELRAAAMLVCRELVRLSHVSSPEIGGELWRTGSSLCPRCRPGVGDAELECPHKPVCVAYLGESRLFELGPMVGTGD